MHAQPPGTRRPARLSLLLAVALVAAGCASASAPLSQYSGPGSVKQVPGDAAGSMLNSGAGTDTAGIVPNTAAGDGSQMIRTGSLQLQVADLRAAVDGAKAAIIGLGGFVSSSREAGGDEQPVATVTYRIPVDKWEDGLATLRKLSIKVVGEQTDAVDVSAQLVDIEARLKNLRAAETALQDIASKSTKVTDVLEVQARLTEVRGQIESMAAQQKALQNQVAYGTVTVTFGLQVGAVTEAAKKWDPAQEVDRASASLMSVLQSIAGGTIWFVIVWLPVLLILAIVLFVAIRVGRRLGIRLPGRDGSRAAAGGGWSPDPADTSGPTRPTGTTGPSTTG